MTEFTKEVYTGKFTKENKDELIKEFRNYPNVTGVDIAVDKRSDILLLCIDFFTPIVIKDKFLGKEKVQTVAFIQEHAKFEYRPKELTLIIG